MAWEDLDTDRIAQIVRQMNGKGLDKSKDLITPAMIKGTGIIFLWWL